MYEKITAICVSGSQPALVVSRDIHEHTAFSSPRLPHLAKCALKLAFELPAATPHNALSTLEKLKSITLGSFGSVGERQSRIIAVSLKTSAANRYILHSGSRDVPSLCAKRIVAIRPMLSCRTFRSRAAVGDADASPTPTPTYLISSRQDHVQGGS